MSSITISELGIANISEYPPLSADFSISFAGKNDLSGYLVCVCKSMNAGTSII